MKKINLLLAAPFLAYALSSCTPKKDNVWVSTFVKQDYVLTEKSKEITVKFLGNPTDSISYSTDSTEYIDILPLGTLDTVKHYNTINIPGERNKINQECSYSGIDISKNDKHKYAKIFLDFTCNRAMSKYYDDMLQ